MGKIIYLISVLSGVRGVNFILLVLIPIVVGLIILWYFDELFFFKWR